ncbi:MAG: TM2 domain-containing protein [Clostridia bacterium]|nr:TM2 domain-containing protein [Clostridia bacterium]
MGSKSKWVAILLCLFFGYTGAHKFYEEKPFTGVLYLFTCGFMGFGIIVDLIILLTKPTRYYP